MQHNKINKALVAALCVWSLIICSMSLQQTLAWNLAFGGTSTFTQKELVFYSSEVNLHAASSEYSAEVEKKKTVFKKLFQKHLSEKLANISSEKLESLSEILETKLNSIKSDKKIAQVLALKEIIDEELELRNEYELDTELLQLLNNA